MPSTLSLWFAAALAITPAVVAWWTGRAVLARAEDPLLPEILFERRRRLMGFALAGVFAIVFLSGDAALWALPLLWIALLLSSYPLRRKLFGEQWNVLAFLRYAIFSTIGQVGVGLLAASAPALVISFALGVAPDDREAAFRIALWSGIVVAAIVAIWQLHYARVFLALHRAVPLRDIARPELVTRLDGILDKAGAKLKRRPHVYRYGAPGAYVMQALAIPSRRHPAVALGTTLLATLTDDEIAAVFAHEVAHHEQFQSSALWRRTRWTWLVLVALVAALPAMLIRGLPMVAMALSWCMPVVLLLLLSKRLSKRRDAETASDVRAVALAGSADAMISALTKLHVYGRVPRRWPHAIENVATHPSLARRIQALRASAEAPPTPRTTTAFTALRSAEAGTVVGFDLERAYWFDGVGADIPLDLHELRERASSYRAVAYADLSELRVAIAGEVRTLRATDRDGRSWSVRLAPDDVAAIQQALDRVDFKLGRQRVPPVAANTTSTRWLALTLLVMLSAAGQLGVALVPVIVVLVRPTLSAGVAAVAAITLARVAIAARGLSYADPVRQIAFLAALVIGMVLGAQGIRRARAEASRGNGQRLAREMFLVAGVLAAVAVTMGVALWPVASEHASSMLGHPLAMAIASALAGAGGALLAGPNRWWRIGGGLTTALSVAASLVLAGSGWLFDRLPAIAWHTRQIVPSGSLRISGTATSLAVSPNGRAFVVSQYVAPRRGAVSGARYLVGQFGDSARVVRASDAATVLFLDDETLIALGQRGQDTLEVRAERVAPDAAGKPIVLWRERLPDSDDPQLLLDRTNRRWLVVSQGGGDFSFVVITDTVGGSSPRTIELGSASSTDIGERLARPLAALPDGAVIWSTLPQLRHMRGSMAPLLFTFTGTMRWELRASDPSGERVLGEIEGFATCAPEVGAEGAICTEHSPNGSHLWRITSERELRRMVDLPPTYDILHADARNRVTIAERAGGRVAVLDPWTRQGIRIVLPDAANGRWLGDATAAGPFVFSLTVGRDGAVLNRFTIR